MSDPALDNSIYNQPDYNISTHLSSLNQKSEIEAKTIIIIGSVPILNKIKENQCFINDLLLNSK